MQANFSDSQAFRSTQQSNIIHSDIVVTSCQTGGAEPKTGGAIASPDPM